MLELIDPPSKELSLTREAGPWRLLFSMLAFAGRIINLTHRLLLTHPPMLNAPTLADHLFDLNRQLYSNPSYWTSPESVRMSIIQEDETHRQFPSGRGYSVSDTSGCLSREGDVEGIVKGSGSLGRSERLE